ncbi:MAG: von Willebrand factor type A domain-containing protein [Negativicutes bacterium]|nr:von Willebrand factor type A domain-containing protein [Negativicutes bacterium]
MKRIIAVLLLTCLIGTAWAAPGNFETSARSIEVTTEVSASDLTLADLLAVLSERCNISIISSPEVADMKVSLRLASHSTLGEALAVLAKNYQLAFHFNGQQNAIAVYKDPYYAETGVNVVQGIMNKTIWPEMRPYSASIAPAAPVLGGTYNTEEYKRINDNSYQEVASSPLSTFSIDVDTASYSNVRRYINSGSLPPLDAVRTEELLNYFTYDYPQPQDDKPFSVTTEVGVCPWQPGHRLVMIGLQGKNIPAEALPPGNLVFLIDVSGSMAEPNKLPLLKTAFKMLVKQLREQDMVSIVVYAGKAGVALEPTPGSDKAKIVKAIDSLEAGGSTAGGEGIRLAYRIAKENFRKNGNNRVILATDGDFNVGVSSEGELTRLIEERRNDGIFLSVIGVGTGNLKDSKMEALADRGNGNYSYIDNAQEAKKVMVGQLAGTLFTIAKDVKLQVEFNPAQVKYYRLIGYEKRVLDKQDFNDDKKDAGDMGAGHSVTALYEVILAGSDEVAGKVDALHYQRSEMVPSDNLLQVKIRYKKPVEDTSTLLVREVTPEVAAVSSDNFRFAAAVAEYAMLLRNSEFKGRSTYRQVLELAGGARGSDIEGYRGEFLRMVETSQLLDER